VRLIRIDADHLKAPLVRPPMQATTARVVHAQRRTDSEGELHILVVPGGGSAYISLMSASSHTIKPPGLSAA
jgi:hypothetical protein